MAAPTQASLFAARRRGAGGAASLTLGVLACLHFLPVVWTAPGFLSRLFEQQARRQPEQRAVDLSHSVGRDTIFWPGFPNVNFTNLVKGRKPGGFWIEANWVSTSEHGGTHLDAPAHFAKGGEHLHEIPVDRFFAPGILVDAADRAAVDPDYQLGTNELQEWERVNGRIPHQAAVLIKFGWSSRWPDRFRYFNTLTPDDASTFHFPGVSLQALQWLVQRRNIKLLGVDVPSVDYGQNRAFEGHQFLCANRVPFVESLTNLNQLPARGMTFFAVPLRLVGGSGFPVRAFALVSGAERRTVGICWTVAVVLAVKHLLS